MAFKKTAKKIPCIFGGWAHHFESCMIRAETYQEKSIIVNFLTKKKIKKKIV